MSNKKASGKIIEGMRAKTKDDIQAADNCMNNKKALTTPRSLFVKEHVNENELERIIGTPKKNNK